uniref:PK domain-containing protein n=1 Tax=Ascaris lumbricoides TaxID=6252 RepID=A0A0M3HIB9_ASCLU
MGGVLQSHSTQRDPKYAQGATAEVEVKKDSTVTLTIDPKYKDKCTEEKIYIDYRNITKIMCPGKRIFIDDGLICLRVTKVGESLPPG